MKKINLTQKQIDESIDRLLTEIYGHELLYPNRGGAYNGNSYLAKAIKHKNEGLLYSSFLNEGVQFEPSADEKGGIIVFSTDVNAVVMSDNRFVNFIKQKLTTIANRLNATKKIDQIAKSNELIGWMVGHHLDGRYTAKNGKQYGENSLSVEIIGVNFITLTKIAEELCRSFKQESVLVKDFSSGRVLFVDPS